jgi:O-antigen/teichoic acid export membrane protein
MIAAARAWLARLEAAGGLRGRFARGAFWSVMAAVASQASNLFTGILVARMLGAEGYGELAMITSTVITVGWFAGLGAGLTATKYIAELRTKAPERAGRIIALTTTTTLASGAVVALLLTLAASELAARGLAAPHLAPVLRWSAVLMLLNVFAGVQMGTLSGFEAFRTIAWLNLAQGALHVPAKLGGAHLFGVQGVVWGMMLVAALMAVRTQMAVRRQCRRSGIVITTRSMSREAGVLVKFALPALAAGALAGPVTWIGNTLLVNSSNGYEEMGVFRAADQWRNLLIFLPGVLGQAILPMLSSLLGEGQLSQARKLLLATIGGLTLITAPVAAVLILARQPIMALYGPDFAGRGEALTLLSLAGLLLAAQTPIGQLVFASGHAWAGALMNLAWAAIFLASTSCFLAAGRGAAGLAAGYVVAFTAHLFLNAALAWVALRRRGGADGGAGGA